MISIDFLARLVGKLMKIWESCNQNKKAIYLTDTNSFVLFVKHSVNELIKMMMSQRKHLRQFTALTIQRHELPPSTTQSMTSLSNTYDFHFRPENIPKPAGAYCAHWHSPSNLRPYYVLFFHHYFLGG